MEDISLLLLIAIIIISVLIAGLSIAAFVISVYLSISYIKYNRKKIKSNVAGKDIARDLLDKNELNNIKVVRSSIFTAFTVGNSYSHYFHRIRLRGLIHDKCSVTSAAMAGQKVGLAILDKEKDPDMVSRIRLLPLITFGPFIFIFIVLVGIVLDAIFFSFNGVASLIAVILGLLFYVWTFLLSLKTMKTEKKAQDIAIKMLQENNYIDEEETEDCLALYHLYNINYILSMIISLLEMIREILKLLIK